MTNRLISFSFLIIFFSCDKEVRSKEIDLSNVTSIEIINKGYRNERFKKKLVLKDSLVINEIIKSLQGLSDIDGEDTASTNYGYISSRFFKKNGDKITISQVYSVYNGVIITIEEKGGVKSKRYRCNDYAFKIENLLYKGNSIESLIDKATQKTKDE